MTCRVEVVGAGTTTWIYDYNDENRLWKIRQVSGTCGTPGSDLKRWIMTYDGDCVRVKEDYFNGTTNEITLYFAGGMYEVTDSGGGGETIVRYYGIGGQRVARYDGSDLEYILTDSQGSPVAALDDIGALIASSQKRYMPFGEVRTDLGTSSQTDFGYTGQREIEGSELMDYNARFLNPGLSRFTQPDTIIASLSNPQTLNRYSYVNNNPIRFTDPTGHSPQEEGDDPDEEEDIDCKIQLYDEECGDDPFAILARMFIKLGWFYDLNCTETLAECFKINNRIKKYDEGDEIDRGEFYELLAAIYIDLKDRDNGLVTLAFWDLRRVSYDTPIYNGNVNSLDVNLCINGRCDKRSDINYVAQGMWDAAAGQTLQQSIDTAKLYKKIFRDAEDYTSDTEYWIEFGYNFYLELDARADPK